jgi:glucose-6-phosphate isomerase
LRLAPGTAFTVESLVAQLGLPDQAELAFKVLEHLAANPEAKVKNSPKSPWWDSTYTFAG